LQSQTGGGGMIKPWDRVWR